MKQDKNNVLNFNKLECTEKAYQAIQHYDGELSCRERQLLILMMRGDSLSRNACEKLIIKVNLFSLLSRGYLHYDEQLVFKQDSTVFADTKDTKTSSDSPVTSDTDDSDINFNPMLEFLAGRV